MLTAPAAPETKDWKALSVAPARTLSAETRKEEEVSSRRELEGTRAKNDSLEARVLSRDSSHLSNIVIGSLVSDDARERKEGGSR